MKSATIKFTTKPFAAFLFAIVMTTVVGCASTTSKEWTGEYIDDTVFTTNVKAAIFNESSLKSIEINVETFKGIIQRGFVKSTADERKTTELARGIKGVKSVKDDLRVKYQ